MARILSTDAEDLEQAAGWLLDGEPVAIPTETVYGLAAPVGIPAAIDAVYRIKGRPRRNPLIVHIDEPSRLTEVAEVIPGWAKALVDAFWPGPLTLILPRKAAIPDAVTAGRPTVAVRCPAHPVAARLVEAVGQPLAAPSANPYTCLSPTRAAHVERLLGDRIVAIVDGGPCREGIESTIVAQTARGFHLLRPGPIERSAIEAVLGRRLAVSGDETRGDSRAGGDLAPGQHKLHYRPETPLTLLTPSALADAPVTPETARIFMRRTDCSRSGDWSLSEAGDIREANRNLYACLHNVDTLGYTAILIERPVAEDGAAEALLERLLRASARS